MSRRNRVIGVQCVRPDRLNGGHGRAVAIGVVAKPSA
jgi:hypothetical protein